MKMQTFQTVSPEPPGEPFGCAIALAVIVGSWAVILAVLWYVGVLAGAWK